MPRLGRRKLPDEQRRTAASLNVRFNLQEWETVEQKAAAAGLTPTEWARFATLERNPPPRRVVPELNQKAWRELGRLAATLNGAVVRFRPGTEDALSAIFYAVRQELYRVRIQLKGESE